MSNASNWYVHDDHGRLVLSDEARQLMDSARNYAHNQFEVLAEYGPGTSMIVDGYPEPQSDDGVDYGPPSSHVRDCWVPGAFLLRDQHEGNKVFFRPTLGTPDDLRSVGKILSKTKNLLVFRHPDGVLFVFVEDRITSGSYQP